ncbi:MAG: Gldg family protein [Clostridia bacterium]|nr:Gldg family protein [Clostridia bacterium]
MKNIFSKAKAAFVAEGRFSSAFTAVLLAILIAVNGIVYALTNYFGLYLYSNDLSEVALSEAPDAIFDKMKQEHRKVEILFCMAEDDLKSHDTGSLVHHTATEMAARYSDVVTVKYMNILTRIDSDMKNRSAKIEKYKAALSEGEVLRDSSVVFTYTSAAGQESYRVLTDNTSIGFAAFYMTDAEGNAIAYHGEEILTAMSVLTAAKAPKKVYFTQYHGEIADISLTSLLVCAGYEIDVINLRDRDIPEDCALLVISSPQTDFEKASEGSGVVTEIERLARYTQEGGHLLVTLHSHLKTPLKNLEAFLSARGISLIREQNLTAIVRDNAGSLPTDAYTLVASYAESELSATLAPHLADRGGVVLTETAALSLTGSAKPLLVSSPSASLEADGKTVDRAGSYVLAATAAVQGGGDITVIPSVYLTATDAMTSNTYSNRTFVYGLIETLYGGEDLPYGCRTVNLMTDTLENLTARAARIYTAVIFLIPTALAAFGFVTIRRRKNR